MRLTPLDSWGNLDSREAEFGSAKADRGIPHASLLTYAGLGCIVFILVSALVYFSPRTPSDPPLASQTSPQSAPRPAADSFVLLTRQRITKGMELKPFMFKVGHAPSGWVPKDSFSDVSQIAGLVAAVNIPARFPLMQDYVSGKTQGNAVSRKIPEGFRAATITTNTTNSVEGWARAGARVDVQWIGPLKGELYSKIMVENAEVLSVERRTSSTQTSSEPAPTTITLLASTSDADKLGLVSGVGELVLHLRGEEDTDSRNDSGILKADDLFVKRELSIDERVQGVARVKSEQGESKTWALIDGKWGARSVRNQTSEQAQKK